MHFKVIKLGILTWASMMARPLVAPRGTAVVSTFFVSTFILFVLAPWDVGWKDTFLVCLSYCSVYGCIKHEFYFY